MRRAARPARAASAAAALALAVVTLVAHAPSIRGGFVFDDDAYVVANPLLRSGEGLRRTWFDLGSLPHYQYYPLVVTSFWLEYRLFGLDPRGYHVVNVLLQALAAVLLWRVLLALALPGAWLAAALFALHPVQVESVAWITERKNLLSGALYLAAALVQLPPLLAGRRWSQAPGRYALALGLFALALLSKSVTASLPAALLLVLWWKRGRLQRADLLALAPMFALGVGFGLLSVYAESVPVGARGEQWALSPVERGLVAGRALWFYAGKLALPVRLCFVYERWQVDAGVFWQWLYPAAALALVAALWLARGRIGRGPLAAVLFFAGTLAPALGFFNVFFMRYSFVADHFQYLASIGLLALFAALAARACSRWLAPRSAVPALLAAALLGMLGALSWRQAAVYADNQTLWTHVLEQNPDAWIAHANLGVELAGRGDLEGAIRHHREALARVDGLPAAKVKVLLASALQAAGRNRPAIRYYREALEVKTRESFDYAQAQHHLGIALAAEGEFEQAVQHLRLFLEVQPDSAAGHVNLGGALGSLGRLDEAVAQYEVALRLDPTYAAAHYNLGRARALQGRTQEAAARYRQALALDPGHAGARRELEELEGR